MVSERNSSQSFRIRFALTRRLPDWLILMKETIPNDESLNGANHLVGFHLICQNFVECKTRWLVGGKTLTFVNQGKVIEFKGLSDSSRFLQ